MSSFWAWSVITMASAFLIWHRLLAYLRYFQQDGYENARFLRWVSFRPVKDPALWLILICALLFLPKPIASIATFVAGAVILGLAQPDPRRSGKIPLRLTYRAKRVLGVAFLGSCAVLLVVFWASSAAGLRASLIASLVLIATSPLILVAANIVLIPYENKIQAGYESEARRRITEVAPLIVGITGSYGKSSSKAMIAHFLRFHAPTLAASGSINTPMGLTRHIRENLIHGHRFLVVEMGAFKTGSIRRLCQLTPPKAGLITAVGDMHLERFGSLEEIVRAKSELAQAIPAGGVLVVCADSPGALRIAKSSSHCCTILYGETSTEDLATRVEQISFSKEGTSFVLRTNVGTFQCFTPLLGRTTILNLAGAFTLAVALGVDPNLIVAAIRTLKPVSNRLEVVDDGGITWIRDAYNSNQFGFRAALEILAALPASRRFLITPGVVELGDAQYGVNRMLAKESAAICDRTIVVSEVNQRAFSAGYGDAGREAQLICAANRTEAFRWVRETVKAGDVVLLENDLPDLYEGSGSLFWRGLRSAGGSAGAR